MARGASEGVARGKEGSKEEEVAAAAGATFSPAIWKFELDCNSTLTSYPLLSSDIGYQR